MSDDYFIEVELPDDENGEGGDENGGGGDENGEGAELYPRGVGDDVDMAALDHMGPAPWGYCC